MRMEGSVARTASPRSQALEAGAASSAVMCVLDWIRNILLGLECVSAVHICKQSSCVPFSVRTGFVIAIRRSSMHLGTTQ